MVVHNTQVYILLKPLFSRHKGIRVQFTDEPTGNLDYNTSLEIMDLFMQLKKEEGQSFIIVTHDPIIATYADRVIFLHDGEVKSEYKNGDDSDNFTNILDIFRSLIA